MPGGGKHSAKWDRCVNDVKAKGKVDNAYAVCNSVLDGECEYSEKEINEAIEAISSSANGPVLRGNKKEKKAKKLKKPHGDALKPAKPKKPKSGLFDNKKPKKPKKPENPLKPHKPHVIKHKKLKLECREQLFKINEAQTGDDGRLFFPCEIIVEGMGNLRDRNYYLPDAIRSGVQVYEGAQAYYDHPSPQEEIQQPNRTINELLGHYEECKAVTNKDGLMELQAKLYVIEGISRADAQDVLKHAIVYAKKYPDKNFVGLSINGDGEGETCEYQEFLEKYSPPAAALKKLKQIEGQSINAINKLTDAFSADVVTAAGAGGKVSTQESKERQRMALRESFKKFWKAVDKGDFEAAEKTLSALKEGEAETEAEKKEREKKEKEKKEAEGKEDGVKSMLQAMKQWQKQNEKKQDEKETEYEARMEAGVKDMLQAEHEKKEKEKKEAADKEHEGETEAEKKEREKKEKDEKEKKEAADDDDDDDDKKKKPKDGDDDDDDASEDDKKEGEADDDDGDDDDDDDKGHADAGKDKKLIGKMLKKHLSMAKQMQAMNEKMEAMSKELEKHESESKQSKKESAEAKTVIAIKAREEMIDSRLAKCGYPRRITSLWRKALESCRSEKEIDETIKSFVETAAQANAERFYVESSRGLVEKEADGSGNNSDLFGIK